MVEHAVFLFLGEVTSASVHQAIPGIFVKIVSLCVPVPLSLTLSLSLSVPLSHSLSLTFSLCFSHSLFLTLSLPLLLSLSLFLSPSSLPTSLSISMYTDRWNSHIPVSGSLDNLSSLDFDEQTL